MSEWEIVEENKGNAVIKVIGVGGGGGNAVQHMVEGGINGTDFIDCLSRFEQDEQTEAVIMIGEIGGDEYRQAVGGGRGGWGDWGRGRGGDQGRGRGGR